MARKDSPDRKRALDALAAHLDRYPDIRIGQALINACRFAAEAVDPFYVEDGDLAVGLEVLTRDPEYDRDPDETNA